MPKGINEIFNRELTNVSYFELIFQRRHVVVQHLEMCDFVAALLGNDLPQCTVILNEGAKENNLFFHPNMD